ncbi:MAG: hypothetical protein ABFE13_08485 [Phycisphaerales bacterium]
MAAHVRWNIARGAVVLLFGVGIATAVPRDTPVPHIEGPWWQVAGSPMDHKYATARQEPVDFAVWQAADGTWQLWSCLRNTTAGGQGGLTRFFYRWEGKRLTDPNWQPMGIAMEADPALGETAGGLQAPHVVKVADTWHMLYGDWVNICHATSEDGKTFIRVIQPNGKTGMFSEGPGVNTRDIMLLSHDGAWYGYYTCHPSNQGMDCLRATTDFATWTDSTVVAFGGQAGTNPWAAECPHVVRLGDDGFYLFRTQSYGDPQGRDIRKRGPARTSVYFSHNPAMFGINQDSRYFLCTMPVAAPEIVLHEGQYYIAALNEGALDGIRIARLRWVRQ